MSNPIPLDLGRRERQIMDIVYAKEQASVGDVLAALPDPPSYSAVRAMLNLLEDKGHLRHREIGRKFVYLPTVRRERARRSALKRLLHTFCDGSIAQAVASLIEMDAENLSPEELDRLSRMIDAAKRKGQSS